MNVPACLGLAYFVSEVGIARARRAARTGAAVHDAGSLAGVWLGIALGVTGGILTTQHVEYGRYVLRGAVLVAALVLFAAGVALRWWAIRTLGRFFTVDVAIHPEHQLVTRGPYRWLRHPSYTGAMLAFLGLALSFQSGPAVLVTLLPVLAALLYRIHVEERALRQAFGEAYAAYAARTRRLIPFLY